MPLELPGERPIEGDAYQRHDSHGHHHMGGQQGEIEYADGPLALEGEDRRKKSQGDIADQEHCRNAGGGEHEGAVGALGTGADQYETDEQTNGGGGIETGIHMGQYGNDIHGSGSSGRVLTDAHIDDCGYIHGHGNQRQDHYKHHIFLFGRHRSDP